MAAEHLCVFNCNEPSGKITLFTSDDLKKCQETLKIRVYFKLKYCDVILPAEVTTVHGYHSNCRKNFLAIHKDYINNYKEKHSSQIRSSSDYVLQRPSTSTAGKLIRKLQKKINCYVCKCTNGTFMKSFYELIITI